MISAILAHQMLTVIRKWFHRYFSDPEAVYLTILLLAVILVFTLMGNILVPIIASIIIAYLLVGFVNKLKQWHIPHLLAVSLVYLLFLSAVVVLFVWLLPLLFQQLTNLFEEIPTAFNRTQLFITALQARHPDLFSAEQLQYIIGEFRQSLTHLGQLALSFSLASIGNVITAVVYLILVPLLTFFFLKDKQQIITWSARFLPAKHTQIAKIWQEIDNKIGRYIRGKIVELLLVAFISVITFLALGLNYAILLGVCVGLSVIIPYVGAIIVTIPIVLVAYLQWGWHAHLLYLLIAYTIILIIDANILFPLLFSERMQLHPVIIILAVLIFGDLWGFWGIFFAIPLATLIDALLKGWPRKIEEHEP